MRGPPFKARKIKMGAPFFTPFYILCTQALIKTTTEVTVCIHQCF